jgi:2-oxo-3-hexenedioate decarboxylase
MEKLIEIAKHLDSAASSAQAVSQMSEMHQFSLADAYKIQRLSIQERLQRGESSIGVKLGFTSKAKMKQMGVEDLIWGILTKEMEFANGDSINRDRFIHPRVEPEIAFLIKKAIEGPLNYSELRNYVEAVVPAVEIIDSRYENFKFSLEDVVADNCSSAAFVLGMPQAVDIDISNLGIVLSINNSPVEFGSSAAILGDPWMALMEASRLMGKYNYCINEGDLVLAGAATAAVAINRGDRVSAGFESLGEIKFSIE